jgi:hypothetical protein
MSDFGPPFAPTSGNITPAYQSLGPSYGGDGGDSSDDPGDGQEDEEMSEAEYARQHSPGRGISDQWEPDTTKAGIRALLASGTYDAPARGGDGFVLGLAEHAARSAANFAPPPAAALKAAPPSVAYATPRESPEHSEEKPQNLPSGPVETVTAEDEQTPDRAIAHHQVYGGHVPSVTVQHLDLRGATHQPHGLAHPVTVSAQMRASMDSHTPRMNRL